MCDDCGDPMHEEKDEVELDEDLLGEDESEEGDEDSDEDDDDDESDEKDR